MNIMPQVLSWAQLELNPEYSFKKVSNLKTLYIEVYI